MNESPPNEKMMKDFRKILIHNALRAEILGNDTLRMVLVCVEFIADAGNISRHHELEKNVSRLVTFTTLAS